MGIIEYPSNGMSNVFICQFSVSTFRVDMLLTSGAMNVRIKCYGYIL